MYRRAAPGESFAANSPPRMAKHDFGPPRDERDLAAYAGTIAASFPMSRADSPRWIERVGKDNVRLLREHGRPIGGLARLSMGQWFGGRSVPTGGIAAVGIDPEARGRGQAQRLMKSVLREMRDSDLALSTLYPSTLRMYRSVGYEPAGARYEVRLPAASIDLSERDLPLRVIEERDDAALRKAYESVARTTAGWLDRHEFLWSRVREWKGEERRGYAVGEKRDVDAYLFLAQRPTPNGRYDLFLSDILALDARAARRLFTFLADHRSIAGDVIWFGGSSDPLLAVLPEATAKIALATPWMLRILDVRAALEARGYPAAASGDLHLAVRDELIAENQGRFVLSVGGGRGEVKKGGNGHLSIDVRGLAALYSGHLSGEGVAAAGLAEGPAKDRALASALFAGPAPSMPDMF